MIRLLAGAVIVLLLALGWSLWRAEVHKGAATEAANSARVAAASAAAIGDVLARERAEASTMDTIGREHEQDRREAEQVAADVAADIGAGTLRLRKQWAACETARLAEASASTRERDALAELRRKDQGDLVRIGRDADDHIRACQAVIEASRLAGGGAPI